MNSVSSPRRPSARASSARRAMSLLAKGLLPPLRLPRGGHADRLVEARGPAVGAVHRELRAAQAVGAERLEEREQQRAPVAAPARPRRARELRDVAQAVVPALAQRRARQALAVLEQQPQGRVPALLLDPLAAPDLQRLGDEALDLRQPLLHE